MNIVLIGYRGCGKTSVARELARILGWPMTDTDALVVQQAGKSIRDIFAEIGEPGFRDIESHVVSKVALLNQHIIGTGGGVVLRQQNVDSLKKNGKLIWLSAPAEILFERIQTDTNTHITRPNLTNLIGIDEVRALLAKRTPIYSAAADFTVNVSTMAPRLIAEEICKLLAVEQ